MRVFIAGATGAVGRRLVPLALRAGHQVTGMTRSEDKAGAMRAGGAEAVVFFYPHRRRGVRHTLGDRARRSRRLQHRRRRPVGNEHLAPRICAIFGRAASAAHQRGTGTNCGSRCRLLRHTIARSAERDRKTKARLRTAATRVVVDTWNETPSGLEDTELRHRRESHGDMAGSPEAARFDSRRRSCT